MEQSSSDPRTPFVIGIVLLGAVLLGGIIWAVASAPAGSGPTGTEANLSFKDDNDPVLGPENAPVVVRIFGDLECPACKAAEPGITHVRETYGDRVKIVWNDYPLPPATHPKARVAALAARCAEEQGRFWEMHDALYQTQSTWSRSSNAADAFSSLAEQIGLDGANFRACYDERRYESKIDADLQEGRSNNVSATPTFFINNIRKVGILTPSEWDALLKPLLADSAPAPATSTPSSP
jgi:protein-disulfide isomerase